jgi:hypothetical protein
MVSDGCGISAQGFEGHVAPLTLTVAFACIMESNRANPLGCQGSPQGAFAVIVSDEIAQHGAANEHTRGGLLGASRPAIE